MLRRPWARWGLIGLGALVLAAAGFGAFVALAQQQLGTTPTASLPCSPQPCLNVQQFTMWVSNVTESGGVLRMQVSFRNSSDATHADPADLQLVDARQQTSPSVQDAPGCTHWSRTEFANGARYGPVTMCFRPASLAAPLTLRWSPDLGLICCQADLKIK